MNAIPLDDITAELKGTEDDWATLLVWADALQELGDERWVGLHDVVASGRRIWTKGEGRQSWFYAANSRLSKTDPDETDIPVFRWLLGDGTIWTENGDGGIGWKTPREAYLSVAQAYVAKRQYKRHLAAIRHEPTPERMLALAEWLDERGDAEGKGWRWLIQENRNPGQSVSSFFWRNVDDFRPFKARHAVPNWVFSGLRRKADLLNSGVEFEQYRSYPSRLHALLDAARAAAKVL